MSRNPFRIIAFYLPQFHRIPENDQWWGPGFTEWTNVAKARPLFRGHYQPHIPADLGFYNLCLPETRLAQAEMAREYGLEGFCYWHYWFGGGDRLLQRPFDEVLKSGVPDFPFCLSWANQSWTGIWHGAPNRVLKLQTYPGMKDHELHFYKLLEAFSDPRYMTVDDKPIFLIYRPQELPDSVKVIDFWRELALKSGLKGLYLVAVLQSWEYHRWNPCAHGYDAVTLSNQSTILVEPGTLWGRLRQKLLKQPKFVTLYRDILGRPIRVHNYADALPYFLLDQDSVCEYYPCLIPNWDNTPRCGLDGLVLHNSTPELFGTQVRKALPIVSARPIDHRILFAKSWNEWAEGNHLEPDQRFGKGYLQVIKDEIAAATVMNAPGAIRP